jgi:hypothetical protein
MPDALLERIKSYSPEMQLNAQLPFALPEGMDQTSYHLSALQS